MTLTTNRIIGIGLLALVAAAVVTAAVVVSPPASAQTDAEA